MITSINAVGGGSKGIVTCGALKRIAEIGYKYDMLQGTSSGALNMLLFSQGDIDVLEFLWLNITNSDVRGGASLINMVKHHSLYDNSPLLATLMKHSNPVKMRVPTYVTVTDTVLNVPRRILLNDKPAELAARACWASSAVPILFPLASLASESVATFYDGGCMDDYNIRNAIRDGAGRIVIIHPSRPRPASINSIIDAIEWQLEGPMWSQYVNEMTALGDMPQSSRPEVIPIIPPEPLDIPLVDFSFKGQNRKVLIQLGYDLAKERLG